MTLLVQGMVQVRRQECWCLAEVCRTEWCRCDHPGGTGHLSEVSWNGKCPARTMSVVRSLTEWKASCKNNVNYQKSHEMGNVHSWINEILCIVTVGTVAVVVEVVAGLRPRAGTDCTLAVPVQCCETWPAGQWCRWDCEQPPCTPDQPPPSCVHITASCSLLVGKRKKELQYNTEAHTVCHTEVTTVCSCMFFTNIFHYIYIYIYLHTCISLSMLSKEGCWYNFI